MVLHNHPMTSVDVFVCRYTFGLGICFRILPNKNPRGVSHESNKNPPGLHRTEQMMHNMQQGKRRHHLTWEYVRGTGGAGCWR